MKKVFAIILVLSIILCACSVAAQPEIEALNTEVKKPIHTEIPEPTKQKIIENLSFYRYETLPLLVEDFEHIIIARVNKREAAVEIPHEYYNGERIIVEEKNIDVLTRSQVEVLEVLKDIGGFIKTGDIIPVDQLGGETENYSWISIGLPLLEEGETYLIFLSKHEEFSGRYRHYRTGSMEGYSKIVDGKIYPVSPSYLIEKGTEIEAFKDRIYSILDGTYTEKYEREDAERIGERFGIDPEIEYEYQHYLNEELKRKQKETAGKD